MIGIIGAMDVEVELLVSKLQNKKENKRSGADYGRKKTNTKKGNMSI